MQEVRQLAAGMKELIAGLKRDSIDARSALENEIACAKTNASKVKAVAAELKEANKEVEEFLSETNSNFSVLGDTIAQKVIDQITDLNGVTLTPGSSK